MVQSRYQDRNTSGWALQEDVSVHTYDSIQPIQSSGTTGDSRARIRTNTLSGNYEVYLVDDPYSSNSVPLSSDDTLIYSYDASEDNKTIGDDDLYEEFFTADNANQDTQLELSTKQDTLALSSTSASTSEQQLEALEDTKGYESLANTGTPTDPNTGNQSTGGMTGSQPSSSSNPTQPPTASTTPTGNVSSTASGSGVQYRYPLNIPDLGYDYIKITSYEYISNMAATGALTSASQPGQSVTNRYTNPLETIILPMQPNISETNAVDWGGDKLNFLQEAGARAAIKIAEGVGGLDATKLKEAAQGAMEDLKRLSTDEGTKKFIAAYFAGQAVGANVQARSSGNVVNPNLELLFSGPQLRTFAFNFKFTPRSPEEALEIKKIIKVFKKRMAPQRSDQGLFLKTPNVFRLEYIYNDTDNQHPYLNKLKPMALRSFGVNYTPDGSYATYLDGGSVTSYGVDMSFGELEPIYADEIDQNNMDDMGF